MDGLFDFDGEWDFFLTRLGDLERAHLSSSSEPDSSPIYESWCGTD